MQWIGSRAETGWTLLSDGFGIPQYTATMIIPSLNQTPAQTNWEMGPVQALVKYIQLKFSEYGERLVPSGIIDTRTLGLIEKYVGPGWRQRDWYSVLQQILKNRVTRPLFHKRTVSLHMGGYELGEATVSEIIFYFDGSIARPGNAASLALAKSIQQRNEVKQDGEIGPATHKAYNARNPTNKKTIKELIAIYNPDVKFLSGKPPWYGKTGTIYAAAAAAVNAPLPTIPGEPPRNKFAPLDWISNQSTVVKASMGLGAGIVAVMLLSKHMPKGKRK